MHLSIVAWGLVAVLGIALSFALWWLWILSKKHRQSRDSFARLRSLFENLSEPAWVEDRHGHLVIVNAAFALFVGSEQLTLAGARMADIASNSRGRRLLKALETLTKGDRTKAELSWVDKTGRQRWFELSRLPVHDQGERWIGNVGILRDLTSSREVRRLALNDPLTGLPNRLQLERDLAELLRAHGANGRLMAVCFLDLDNFKYINDSVGHGVGDKILVATSKRIAGSLKEGDIIARVGGDEFAVLLVDLLSQREGVKRLEDIRRELVEPVRYERLEFDITVSIGVAFAPEGGRKCWQLLRNADLAMQEAKRKGRNRHVLFSSRIAAHSLKQLVVERRIKHAIDNNELYLCYQPMVSYKTGRIKGVEALVRWNDPVNGAISPEQFIPAAETTGTILLLGAWVLRTALRDAKMLQAKFDPRLCLAVNISALQIRRPPFADELIGLLNEFNFPPNLLELELTETAVMDNADMVLGNLTRLRHFGVRVSVDDFGTGYSNLGYLSRFPIDTMKIDRSFVRDIHCRNDNLQIATAIVQLAKSFNLDLIAEGTQTREEVELITSLGVDTLQGFYFERPLRLERLKSLLQFRPNFHAGEGWA